MSQSTTVNRRIVRNARPRGAPEAFIRQLRGRNFGKLVTAVPWTLR
jgi:NADPH-dependent curcumin reductase CurA